MSGRSREPYVYEGQPGLAAIVNAIIDLCCDHQRETAGPLDGTTMYTDADDIAPSEILDLIRSRGQR